MNSPKKSPKMNLLKRLYNLWKLSGLENQTNEESKIYIDKEKKMGYVVKLTDDLSKLIEK